MDNSFTEPLAAKTSVLLLVDYQARMFWGASAVDSTYVKNNVMALSKGAEILGVPTVLTTINAKMNGAFLPEIVEMFPGINVIDRKMPSFDAFEDKDVFTAVKKTGRKQLVLSGLWTSMCMAFTALRGLREGLSVYGVMDTASSESKDAHEMAIKRMIQAGVVPCTWMQVISEWMHDWQNPNSGELHSRVYSTYNGYFGQQRP
jgi:nicotinamidase-related amidase